MDDAPEYRRRKCVIFGSGDVRTLRYDRDAVFGKLSKNIGERSLGGQYQKFVGGERQYPVGRLQAGNAPYVLRDAFFRSNIRVVFPNHYDGQSLRFESIEDSDQSGIGIADEKNDAVAVRRVVPHEALDDIGFLSDDAEK
jgi:hypothetical protein